MKSKALHSILIAANLLTAQSFASTPIPQAKMNVEPINMVSEQALSERIKEAPEVKLSLRKLFYKANKTSSLMAQISHERGIERVFRSYTVKEDLEEGLFHVAATLGMIINPIQGLFAYAISSLIQSNDQPFDQFQLAKEINSNLTTIQAVALELIELDTNHMDQSELSTIAEDLLNPFQEGSESKLGKLYEKTNKLSQQEAKQGIFLSAKQKIASKLKNLRLKSKDLEDPSGVKFNKAFKRLYQIYLKSELN